MSRLPLVLSLLLVVSCADPGQQETGGVVGDSAGIRLIDLPSDSDRAVEVALVVDSSWHPAQGIEFGRLTDLAMDPSGRTVLLDGMAARVYVRSPFDESWTSFGRTGEGPGEFSPMGTLQTFMLTDSSILFPDLHLQRITEFTFDGTVLSITPFPFMAHAIDWRLHPDGGVVFRTLDQRGDDLVRWIEDRVDTLYSFSVLADTPNLLLQPWVLWDLTTDGDLVSGRSDRGVVELRAGSEEEPSWISRWSIPTTEIGEEELAHLRGLIVESVQRTSPGASDEAVAQNVALVHYPDQAPVLAGILTAPNGDVWVRRAKPVLSMGLEALGIGSAEAFGGARWDILNGSGRLRERVRLPERFTPRRFSGPWLYGILEDEIGVQTPARVRVGSG